MDNLGFVLIAYIVAFAASGALAWRTIRRGRALARQLPEEDKSWT